MVVMALQSEVAATVPRGDLSLNFSTLLTPARHLAVTTRGPFPGSTGCHWAQASWTLQTGAGKRRILEELWQDFFEDPSQWWDSRSGKANARYPDFKHKKSHESLWVDGKLNPPWVGSELAAMLPGSVSLDRFAWNNRLARYVKTGLYEKALEGFLEMQHRGMSPNSYTFVPVINACSSLRALEEGRRIHAQILRSGFESDMHVCCCLVDMYAKCGRIRDAWRLFDRMLTRDVVSWNVMILGYMKCGEGHKALELFWQMYTEGVEPNHVTFMAVLNACGNSAALEEGRRVHEKITRHPCSSDILVGNCLIDMYAKCSSIKDAWRVFSEMPTHNVVSWNIMILGYVKVEGQKALELFQSMQREGVEPDAITFVRVVNACANIVALDEGRRLHERILQRGLDSDVLVGNSLVDMYVKCGSLDSAWRVFNEMPTHNVVSWNTIVFGYSNCAEGQKALELFRQMQQEGVEPDSVTFVGVLNACASVRALEEGRRVHEWTIRCGYASRAFVGSSLIDMYAKCGLIEDAWTAFNKIPTRDLVCWNAIILGHVKCGQGRKALELSQQMQREGLHPNSVTFVGMLNACASLALLQQGRCVHKEIIKTGCESNVFVGSCLVDMYAKCGSIQDAREVFDKMPTHNVVSWTTMLGGYAMHGHAKEAIELFEQMCQEGIEVNGFTFISLISACSHVGLVDEGLHYFESMPTMYDTAATLGHFSCVVNLLGHAGRLQEAEDLIKVMSCEADSLMWMSLLGSCSAHCNVEMGERVAKQVLDLDPDNALGYVLLSNLYCAAGKWNSSAEVLRQGLERDVKKQLECSWVEVNDEVHSFTVDSGHPRMDEIHAELKILSRQIGQAGYVPVSRFMPHDIHEETMFRLCDHSEKLAIAFGLIATPPGTTLHIFKNQRVCVNCHTATKFISKIVEREIIIKDLNRFHHFDDGICSCKDCW